MNWHGIVLSRRCMIWWGLSPGSDCMETNIKTKSDSYISGSFPALVCHSQKPWVPQYKYSINFIALKYMELGIMMTSSNENLFLVTGPFWGESTGFPSQRPVTRSFHVFFNLRPNKWLNKQLRCWRFEMQSYSLWRHCNGSIWNGTELDLLS